MADFSFLSDTDDSAVEDLISQARDLCVLEQVAAINCSGFADEVLPADVESRFSRLKSFPATTTTGNPKPKPRPFSHASSARFDAHFASKTHLDDEVFSPSRQDQAGKKMGSKSESQSGSLSPPLDSPGMPSEQRKTRSKGEPKRGSVSISSNYSSDSSPGRAKFPSSKRSFDGKKRFGSASNSSSESSRKSVDVSKRGFDKKKRFGLRPESRSFSNSPLGSSKYSRESPSPPRKPGCFWCSPKKGASTRKEDIWTERDDFGWSKNEELLADLGSFSIKEQRKILKKAMVEQKKISLEAQKIVKLAKQASLRMNVSGIDDELSDD